MTTSADLPIARSASAMPTAEPMASPSARWCDERRKRWPARIWLASRSSSDTLGLVRSGIFFVLGSLGAVGVFDASAASELLADPCGFLLLDLHQDLLDPILRRHRLIE